MLYPFAKADLLPRRRLRVRLYRRVSAWPLTLGHLRVAELLENRLVAPDSPPPEPLDFGQLIALTGYAWSRALRLAQAANPFFLLRRDAATPRDLPEVRAAIHWLTSQRYWPARVAVPKAEQDARARERALAGDHAASPAMRLAVAASAIPGALDILRVRSVYDATLPQLTHLLTAHAETQGAHHAPRSLIAAWEEDAAKEA